MKQNIRLLSIGNLTLSILFVLVTILFKSRFGEVGSIVSGVSILVAISSLLTFNNLMVPSKNTVLILFILSLLEFFVFGLVIGFFVGDDSKVIGLLPAAFGMIALGIGIWVKDSFKRLAVINGMNLLLMLISAFFIWYPLTHAA